MILVAEPTLFVAAFNHEDPGVLAVAQRCMLFRSLMLYSPLTCPV